MEVAVRIVRIVLSLGREANMGFSKFMVGLLIISSGGFLATTLVFAALWVRAREQAIRAQLDRHRGDERSPEFEHLVNAVDAIAVEVERISEAQRFTAKVLTEREGSAAPKRIPER